MIATTLLITLLLRVSTLPEWQADSIPVLMVDSPPGNYPEIPDSSTTSPEIPENSPVERLLDQPPQAPDDASDYGNSHSDEAHDLEFVTAKWIASTNKAPKANAENAANGLTPKTVIGKITPGRKRDVKRKSDQRGKEMAVAAKTKPTEVAGFITPGEFGKHFKLSRSTVQSMMDSGAIKAIPMPTADPDAKKRTRRIPMSEVKRIEAGK